MINKYKKDIIDQIWQYIDWQKNKEINSILLVSKDIGYNIANNFEYYRCYIECICILFVLHDGYDTTDPEFVKWKKYGEFFFELLQSDQDTITLKYTKFAGKHVNDIAKLQLFALEFCKFAIAYQQRNAILSVLSEKAKNYNQNDYASDIVTGINVEDRIKNLMNAILNISQYNPIKYVPATTLTDEEYFHLYKYDNIFKQINEKRVPFTNDFIQELRATCREITFQLFLRMIDHRKNRSISKETYLLEDLLWAESTPYYQLRQIVILNYGKIDMYSGNTYHWNNILSMLQSAKDLDLEEKMKDDDILIVKETEKSDFIEVRKSKIKEPYSDLKLYNNLNNLYKKLEDKKSFETSCKEAFIYRLSGFNRPQDLSMKWIRKKSYLGKIIRCLYETDKEEPPYKDMTEYFGIGKSNIAGAKKIIKGERDTNEVVELLTKCGFTNVDVFEDPYKKKN